MRIYFLGLLASLAMIDNLFAAEAGMPQLDPKYWASQAFWLILVFTLLYLSISKFFVPKIKDALEDRDNKIKKGEVNRSICDFIAGMTDRYAIHLNNKLK